MNIVVSLLEIFEKLGIELIVVNHNISPNVLEVLIRDTIKVLYGIVVGIDIPDIPANKVEVLDRIDHERIEVLMNVVVIDPTEEAI